MRMMIITTVMILVIMVVLVVITAATLALAIASGERGSPRHGGSEGAAEFVEAVPRSDIRLPCAPPVFARVLASPAS